MPGAHNNMSQKDGYRYEGISLEKIKVDDDPSKTKMLEANGAKVKTRRPKSPRFFKWKVIAAVLIAVILLIVVLAVVLVFASRDTTKPVFTRCPGPVAVTVHSLSDAANVSASWAAPMATDNSGTVNLTSSHRPGDRFPRGSTTNVTYRAVDASGNAAECSFQVSVVDCAEDEWRCNDGTCISDGLVCDGTPVCPDNSDELLCADCAEEDFLFPCDEDTKCVPDTYLCDGTQHCDDFEDERYCGDCEANGLLSCRGAPQCYRLSDACNNVIDCPRFSDEFNCYECNSIAIDGCQSLLPYNETFFPSVLPTAEEAIDFFMDFQRIMDCHEHLELFLCAYLFPECGKGGVPHYVCSSFCQEVQDSCGAHYANENGKELNFFCGRYPESPDADSEFCRSPFEGCRIDGATEVDISNGTHYPLYSPNYPMKYPAAFDCRWIFRAAPGKYILFVLVDLALHSDGSVLMGPGEEPDLNLATYFFRSEVRFGKWLLNVTVPSDTAWFQLYSGSTNGNRGYEFEVMQVEAVNETCGDDEFRCDVGGCYSKTRLCDGFPDCYDAKDELECDVCPYYDMVRCGDGSCIHRSGVCDGYPDCNDDEDNCTFACEEISSIYLNDLLVCDSFNDCGNHADELQNCTCIEGRQFDCGERCIPVNYLCDGTYDCADGSDELDCTCINWKRACDDGTCIPFWFFCDSSPDCSDGSDENDCPECPGNFFQCDNLECIEADGICDGYYDCSDQSDENNCPDVYFECLVGAFRCTSAKLCVPDRGVCDGVRNCPGGEDEENCDRDIPAQSEACGERNIELTVASPNFTLVYPAVIGLPARCTWFITSPPGTRIVVAKGDDFPFRQRLKAGHGHDPRDTGALLETFDLPMDKGVVSRENTMWLRFETALTFITFEIHFRSVEKVCPGNQRQCYSKYDECIPAESWCDQKTDCDSLIDEQQCLRLENQGDSARRREGIIMITIEGNERYLCYDDKSWSEGVGDVICNEYGYGFMNDSSFEDIGGLGLATDGFYMLSGKDASALLASNPKPLLYTLVKHFENCPSEKVIRISCEDQECGTQGRMPRVVSGRDALPGEVPWIVSLSHQRGRTVDHYCGGALISNKYVVTAGHCVQGFADPRVLIGAMNLTSENAYRQIRFAKRSILFPTYSNFNLNDIALIELEVPIVISDRARPVCLPPKNDSHLTEVGSSASMAGWGNTVPLGLTPLILQTARATIVDTETCRNFEERAYVNDNIICCMNQYGEQNACKGDSGGPLFKLDGGRWYEIGLVSRGGQPSCSAPKQIVVYTRLSKFLDFIETYVKT